MVEKLCKVGLVIVLICIILKLAGSLLVGLLAFLAVLFS